jgi:hypothetical protein
MTVAYIVLDQGSLVYARADGVLTADEFIAHEQALIADSEVTCRYRHLLDMRRVTGQDVDGSRLLAGLQHVQASTQKIAGSRCAVVAHDACWFNIRFQRQCEAHGLTLIAFNDPATACLWLGVDYAHLMRKALTGPSVRPVDQPETPGKMRFDA